MGGLRLDSREGLLKGGESGPAIVPGDPDKSLMIQAIRQTDKLKMPKGGRLKLEEIDALTEWVKAGAVWPTFAASVNTSSAASVGKPAVAGSVTSDSPASVGKPAVAASVTSDSPASVGKPAVAASVTSDSPASVGKPAVAAAAATAEYVIKPEQRAFWSFQPLRKPPAPAVSHATWPKSDIDRFVLARLEKEGLAPVRAADKRTLLRRATLDLTGLPPTPEEIDAFERDDAADAFAKVVDRLLASPRYGESWGRMWLDVARHGEG